MYPPHSIQFQRFFVLAISTGGGTIYQSSEPTKLRRRPPQSQQLD